ncbi:MAG: hypothetical protein O2794_03765 [bacterium]|nr:hypothetical protein [bacterium]
MAKALGSYPGTFYQGVSDHAVDEVSRGNLFGPDNILPGQWADMARQPISDMFGEAKLMLAVLEDAVSIFQTGVHPGAHLAKKKLVYEVRTWFSSRNDSWLYSFEAICGVLQIDPDILWQGLLKWEHDVVKNHSMNPHVASRRVTNRKKRINQKREKK